MNKPLADKVIAVLVASGFEETHFTSLQQRLAQLGARFSIVSNGQGLVNGWNGNGWGLYFPIDKSLSEAMAADYDAVIVPGGARSIRKLSETAHTKRVLKHFIEAGKPTVIMGDAAALLATMPVIEGRTVACPDGLRDKLSGIGAVHADGTLDIDGALMSCVDPSAEDGFINHCVSLLTAVLEDEETQAAA